MTPASDVFWTRRDRLRAFRGGSDTYWPLYLDLLVQASGAVHAFIYEAAAPAGPWREVARSGFAVGTAAPLAPELLGKVAELAAAQGYAEGVGAEGGARQAVLGLRVEGGDGLFRFAILLAEARPAAESGARQERLRLLADQPAAHFAQRRTDEAKRDLAAVSGALELLNELNPHREFLPAAMAFVNELAARLPAMQVALCWQEGRLLRLKAVSNLERFSAQVELVRDLEAVMEEAAHQDDEITWPAEADATVITREHGQFARKHGVPHLLSMPLRARGALVGVVHLHRGDQPFTGTDLAVLRVWCDQAAPWLDQLRRHGVWFGARWQIRGRTVLGRLWGVEDAWLKLGVVLGALVLAGAIFGGRMFRVDAPFILRSASQAFIPAPFDGFIQSVTREIGDPVEADGVLLVLDESVLRQRESGLLADIARYRGEAERAESAGRFAEMRIAQAQGRQAAAELEVVRYQLKRAMLRAPFAGTVMEGRHRERIGAAVKQGELLFRVARTDRVYAEIDVDERDVQELREGARGEIAFTSRPDESFPLRVVRIEPAGTTKNAANVFVVRAELPGAARAWWRPGMTGVAKIEAGRRSYLWIATHRLVDFLRLKLWWW